jgi:hypothetical protein
MSLKSCLPIAAQELYLLSQVKISGRFIMFLAVTAGWQKGGMVIKQGCDIQLMVSGLKRGPERCPEVCQRQQPNHTGISAHIKGEVTPNKYKKSNDCVTQVPVHIIRLTVT